MEEKVVCAIVIGDVKTNKCDTYWLTVDEYEEFTELLREKINKKLKPLD